MSKKLPKQLQYLNPAIKHLESQGELHELSDFSMLIQVLRERVAGMPKMAARKQIVEDRKALELWLSEFQEHADAGYFIQGFLLRPIYAMGLIYANDEDLKPPAPTETISMDVPVGYSSRIDGDSLVFKRRRIEVFVSSVPEELYDDLLISIGTPVPPGGTWECVVQEVAFGPAQGIRVKCKYQHVTQMQYLLKMPGGYGMIQLNSEDKSFVETDFENALPSIRVVAIKGS
jgi:hypothetical protein